MSDAYAMIERCGRHQHPELFGRRALDPLTLPLVTAIVEMSSDLDREPVLAEDEDRPPAGRAGAG